MIRIKKVNSSETTFKDRCIVFLCFLAAVIMVGAVIVTAVKKHNRPLLISGCYINASVSGKEDIQDFARELGYECESVSAAEIVIPTDFSAVLDKYNDIQKPMGSDLRDYRGKVCTLYTLTLRSDGYMHLLLCADRIIAGDMDNGRPDGVFYPLAKKIPPDKGA